MIRIARAAVLSLLAATGCSSDATGRVGAGDVGGDTGADTAAVPDPDERTAPTPILDTEGAVQGMGWARGPIFEFDAARVPADRQVRIREWDFYALQADDFAASFLLTRIAFESVGVVIMANVTLHDYATGETTTRGPTIFDDPEALVLQPNPNGVYHLESSAGTIDYGRSAGARTIDFALGDLSGHVEFDDAVGDSLALVTPFPDEGEFFYENKAVALRVRGAIEVGAVHYAVPEDAPLGVMDWVRAVVPSQLDWTWATGQGMVCDRLVGLNLGTVFGDETHGTPNAIIVDGHLNKLGRVDWTYEREHPELPWRMNSADGRVNLALEPTTGFFERIHVDLGFYRSDLWKPYGTWQGTVVLDDGSVLDLTGIAGAAEYSETTW